MYREAEYRVLGDPSIVLRIDVASAALAHLHRALGVDCSAFITACNPGSRTTAAAINLERQALLAQDLASQGLVPVEAVGMDPSGRWAAEPSFLVPGMSQPEAERIGVRYAQNAIAWAGSDALLRLILLR